MGGLVWGGLRWHLRNWSGWPDPRAQGGQGAERHSACCARGARPKRKEPSGMNFWTVLGAVYVAFSAGLSEECDVAFHLYAASVHAGAGDVVKVGTEVGGLALGIESVPMLIDVEGYEDELAPSVEYL